MKLWLRVALAIDQGLCLILLNQNDFTISGWAYVQKIEKDKKFWANFINGLFFLQKNHCLEAFLWEYQTTYEMQDKFSKTYVIACKEKSNKV